MGFQNELFFVVYSLCEAIAWCFGNSTCTSSEFVWGVAVQTINVRPKKWFVWLFFTFCLFASFILRVLLKSPESYEGNVSRFFCIIISSSILELVTHLLLQINHLSYYLRYILVSFLLFEQKWSNLFSCATICNTSKNREDLKYKYNGKWDCVLQKNKYIYSTFEVENEK